VSTTIGYEHIRVLDVTPSPAGADRLLGAVDKIHESGRSAVAIAADALLLVAAGLVTGVGPARVALLATVVVAGLYVSRRYVARSTTQTQGVLWYPASIAAPFAMTMLGVAVLGERLGLKPGRIADVAIAFGAALVGLRALTWAVLSTTRRRGRGLRPTLVVGTGPVADTIVRKLGEYPEAGLDPVGVLPLTSGAGAGRGVAIGATLADLPELVWSAGIRQLVIAPEGDLNVGMAECIEGCDGLDVDVAVVPPLAELFLSPGHVSQIGGLPLLPMARPATRERVQPGKRVFDIVVAALVLLMTAPLLAVVAIAIKLGDGGPALYRQRRVGFRGEPFRLLKFRSMRAGADREVIGLAHRNATDGLLFKVVDDPRVTRIGRIIRRYSIDELPQLLNVIRGDMSLVGPRPLAVDPEDFGTMDGRRHSTLPGVTGYWQVSGGNGLTYQEMVKLDLAYIENWSLWLDIRLLLRTVPALVYRHGPW
jgi:exopolysaccharide biosynthesis polyprenyl glycosylphosphotransferase